MTKGQEQVKDFMRFFGQGCPDKPIQIDEATAKLRAKLILEEAFETITKGLGLRISISNNDDFVLIDEENLKSFLVDFDKVKEVDLVELADGLGDSAYVAEFGIQDIIHASNMTKAWKEEDLDEAKRLYPTAIVEAYGGGLYRLIREDGKVIKSPYFKDPTEAIAAEIKRQQS